MNIPFGCSGEDRGYVAAIHPEHCTPMSVMRFGGTPDHGIDRPDYQHTTTPHRIFWKKIVVYRLTGPILLLHFHHRCGKLQRIPPVRFFGSKQYVSKYDSLFYWP